MEKKEYVSPGMSIVLLDDARVLLDVSIENSGDDVGIPDWN